MTFIYPTRFRQVVFEVLIKVYYVYFSQTYWN